MSFSHNNKKSGPKQTKLYKLLEKYRLEWSTSTVERLVGDYDNALATPPKTIVYLLYARYHDMDESMASISDAIAKEKESIEVSPKIQHLSKFKLAIDDDMSLDPKIWDKHKHPLQIPLLKNIGSKYSNDVIQLNTIEQIIVFLFDASKKEIPQIHETIVNICPKDDNIIKQNILIAKPPKLNNTPDIIQYFTSFVQVCDKKFPEGVE